MIRKLIQTVVWDVGFLLVIFFISRYVRSILFSSQFYALLVLLVYFIIFYGLYIFVKLKIWQVLLEPRNIKKYVIFTASFIIGISLFIVGMGFFILRGVQPEFQRFYFFAFFVLLFVAGYLFLHLGQIQMLSGDRVLLDFKAKIGGIVGVFAVEIIGVVVLWLIFNTMRQYASLFQAILLLLFVVYNAYNRLYFAKIFLAKAL